MGAIVALAAVAALAGGGVAAVGVHALDASDKTVTTTVEAAPSSTDNGGNSGTTSPGVDANAAFARSGGKSVSSIYKQDAPGVVTITSTVTSSTSGDFNPFGPGQSQQETAQGSGFVIDKEGRILTNAHVVEGATSVVVAFEDGVSAKATVLGRDSLYDLAVIKVDVPGSELHPLKLGSVTSVQVGDPVVAIGNPFGLDRTVTAGIVSALQREVRAPNNYTIDHVIQTDAPINSGNSGGPLIDAQGAVIGVNSQIETASGGGGNVGIGFAVPSNTVKSVVAQLLADGRVDRAFLGVTLQDVRPNVAGVLRLPADKGVLVGAVKPGSPAAKAGVKGGTTQVVVAGESYQLGGDMIVALNGKPVSSVDELRDAIAAHKPGQTVSLTVVHANGTKATMNVELGRAPTTPAS